MGVYSNEHFMTDFAIRTRENLKRIEYISDMTVDHERELEALFRIVKQEKALNELASYVTDVARKNHSLREDEVITPTLLQDLFSMHGNFEKSAKKAYSSMENRPPYLYFDGTQLLNSFLGLIVLPYERFKNISFSRILTLMKKDKEDYTWLEGLIDRLYTDTIPDDNREFIYSSYNKGKELAPGKSCRVVSFWKHLRNSFAHSGDGSLFFFPIADYEKMKDITHIGFFDQLGNRFTKGQQMASSFFLAKIKLDDVREIAARMDRIIRVLEEKGEIKAPLSFDEAIERVKTLSQIESGWRIGKRGNY